MKEIAAELLNEFSAMPVVDAHEHLASEAEALGQQADIFTRILCHYTITNAIMSGLKNPECGTDLRGWLKDQNVPLDTRWKHFRETYAAIKDTGYVLSARRSVKELYGFDDIKDDNYQTISDALQNDNKPGLYDKLLKQKCKVTNVINQGSWNDGRGGFASFVSWEFRMLGWGAAQMSGFREMCRKMFDKDFEDPVELLRALIERRKSEGMVGMKLIGPQDADTISDEAALKIFASTSITDEEARNFGCWAGNKCIELAPEYNLVVAVHCGIIWCGGNFTTLNPTGMIPLIEKYNKTTFDLYHGGMPWVREIAVMANQYPNIVLNMCWCHQISPYMTQQMINEWIDLVSTNRIIAFGGDNCFPEKTVGALMLARENIAWALATRIEDGRMTFDRAIDTAREWFYDNPKRIYDI